MTFVFVAMVMTAAPVDVLVDVASGAPCVTKPSLESSLVSRGLRVGKGGLNVRVAGSASQLVLTGNRGAQKFERTVPVVSGDCDAVTRVAVALISSWATPTSSRPDAGVAADSLRTNVGVAGQNVAVETDVSSTSTMGRREAVAVDAGVASSLSGFGRTNAAADAGASVVTSANASTRTNAPAGSSASVNSASASRRTNLVADGGAPSASMNSASAADRTNPAPDGGGSASSMNSASASRGANVATDGGVPSLASVNSASASDRTTLAADGGASSASANSANASGGTNVAADGGLVSSAAVNARTNESSPSPADPLLARIGTSGAVFESSPVDAGIVDSTPRSAPAPLSLAIIALGGVANDPLSVPETVTTGLGQLAVRGAIGRWGLLIDGGFDSARSRSIVDVTVTASSQWLSLSFSVAFQPLDRFSFDLALGVRGWRFGGSATGVEDPKTPEFFSLGGVVSAGFNYQLIGPLHVHLRPFASLRGNRGAFLVENLGTVIPIEPLTFGALLGAMLRFD